MTDVATQRAVLIAEIERTTGGTVVVPKAMFCKPGRRRAIVRGGLPILLQVDIEGETLDALIALRDLSHEVMSCR